MPRARRSGTLRKSRTTSEVSGVTISTIPSGVTLTMAGILYNGNTGITPTEVGYLEGLAGPAIGAQSSSSTGFMVSGDSIAWIATGGASLSINFTNLGITKLYGFNAIWADHGGGVSATLAVVRTQSFPSGVSIDVAAIDDAGTGTTTLSNAGGTIYWMAFHT